MSCNCVLALLLLLAAGLVAAQELTPAMAPPFEGASFGNCDTFEGIGRSTVIGLMGEQLLAEAQRRGETTSDTVTLFKWKVTCLAFGTEVNKYSSVAVAIEYSCCGDANRRRFSHFSFKCDPDDNTWTIYGEDEPEFNMANHDPSFNNIAGVRASPPGLCSICFNVARASIHRPGSRYESTQCLGCLPTCSISPRSGCVPSSMYSSESCVLAEYQGHRVSSCPLPDYVILPGTSFCMNRLTISYLRQSTPDTLCSGDTITYNCSIVTGRFLGGTVLTWRVTYPGHETVNISYNATDPNSNILIERLNGAIVAITHKFNVGYLFESTITVSLLQNASFSDTDIECGLSNYGSQKASVFNGTFNVPRLPFNFSVTSLTRNLVNTIVELQWTLDIPNELSMPETVDVIMSPEPLLQPSGTARSPYSITLVHDTIYTATLALANCAGVNTTSIEINTGLLPTSVVIQDQITGQRSTSILTVTISNGDPPPSFNCVVQADPSVTYTVSWAVNESSTHYTTTPYPQGTLLVWLKPLDLSDGGLYLCNVYITGQATQTVQLDIQVRYPATLTSIYSRYPVTAASYSDYYFVPVGFIGPAVTCAGVGLQPWTIYWNADGENLDSQKVTFRVNQIDSVHFSADLVIIREFSASDVATFTCILQTDEFTLPQVRTASLRAVLRPPPSPISLKCSKIFSGRFFQIRVLDVPDCNSWEENEKLGVSSDFELVLRSAVFASCEACDSTNQISITSSPMCSVAVGGAITFWGIITSSNTVIRDRIFCAISSWQRSSPEVKVRMDTTFHRVDYTCPVEINSSSEVGCEVPSESRRLLFVTTGLIGGPMFGLVVVVLYSAIIFLQCRNRWRKRVQAAAPKLPQATTNNVIITYDSEDVRYRSGAPSMASVRTTQVRSTASHTSVPKSIISATPSAKSRPGTRPPGLGPGPGKSIRPAHPGAAKRPLSPKPHPGTRTASSPMTRLGPGGLKGSRPASSPALYHGATKSVRSASTSPRSHHGGGRPPTRPVKNLSEVSTLSPNTLHPQSRKPLSYHSEFKPAEKLAVAKPQRKAASYHEEFGPVSKRDSEPGRKTSSLFSSAPKLSSGSKQSKKPASSVSEYEPIRPQSNKHRKASSYDNEFAPSKKSRKPASYNSEPFSRSRPQSSPHLSRSTKPDSRSHSRSHH